MKLQIPTLGARTLTLNQVRELHRQCVNVLEASLPDEGKGWRDHPARARTSGVKATAELARNKRRAA